MNRDEGLRADWETDRREELTAGLALTPAERVAWLEEATAFARRADALPRAAEGDQGPEGRSDPAAPRGPG